MVVLHTKADYCPQSRMPKREYFYIWNYEFMLFRTKNNGKKHFLIRWNYKNRFGLYIQNLIHRIRMALGIKYKWQK